MSERGGAQMEQVEIRFRIDEGDAEGEALRSLYRRLYRDPSLERTTKVELQEAPQEEGAMGGAWETVNILLTHATALSSLAVSVAAWRQSRPSSPPLNAQSNGTTVTVRTDDPEAVRRLLEALSSADNSNSDDSGDSSEG
ncbi:effector-associated constant component EACC1 [Streptomyces milbemycinicus]|uniref:effector-associated constant component EACC1 n=1 Tax=Streptomyces milbemycinicus TaxID=476552 RepID=UPI0033C0EFCA